MNDTLIIAAKIFDNNDDPSVGPVTWRPFLSAPPPDIQHQPPSDLTEPPSLWTVYASDGQTTVATWDSSQKTAGAAALKIATESGFDVMIQYWPEEPKIASWDLSGMRYLELWLLAANAHPFQQNSIRLGNESGGYYSYDAAADVFSSAIGRWKHLVIPLAGNATWTRTSRGQVALSDISYVQIHADTWDAGFTLWIDELSFAPTQSVVSEEEWPSQISLLENYPNPFNASTSIQYQVLDAGAVTLKICDLLGREVALLVDDRQERGTHTLVFDAVTLGTGVYFCTLQNAGRTASRKMLLVK
jgi:hypothetical protein